MSNMYISSYLLVHLLLFIFKLWSMNPDWNIFTCTFSGIHQIVLLESSPYFNIFFFEQLFVNYSDYRLIFRMQSYNEGLQVKSTFQSADMKWSCNTQKWLLEFNFSQCFSIKDIDLFVLVPVDYYGSWT